MKRKDARQPHTGRYVAYYRVSALQPPQAKAVARVLVGINPSRSL